ncbi:GIN domain-containing protein (plasmid) [Ralstonia pseudosolanacearum]
MDIFSLPDDREESAWAHAESYIKEERSLQAIRKIVVKGSVDVVFRRLDTPTLVVAGETADAVASVKTDYKGDKLVIEREGMSISLSSSVMVFHGSVGPVVMGDIVNGKPMGAAVSFCQPRVRVGIALPESPSIKIKGPSDVILLDLLQAGLDLEIEGSGDITALGQVVSLDVQIAGSGDVDASELIADRASLSVTGSGDIEAFVRSEVRARVTGSGDILVRGNPSQRNHSVTGSGKIKFK